MTKRYFHTIDATWPPLAAKDCHGFLIRNGGGSNSKRVCCATLTAPLSEAHIPAAESEMRDLGQTPLFMIRPDDSELDTELERRGYAIVDPVTIMSAPTQILLRELPPLSCFDVFPPLAIMEDIWAEGGITEGRLAVMDRANCAKTTLLGRINGRAAGVAFVGLHEKTGMLHALEVKKATRRQGVAVNIMCSAAQWAQDNGADEISIVVTKANAAANKLYASLNMKPVGHYHYRIKQ